MRLLEIVRVLAEVVHHPDRDHTKQRVKEGHQKVFNEVSIKYPKHEEIAVLSFGFWVLRVWAALAPLAGHSTPSVQSEVTQNSKRKTQNSKLYSMVLSSRLL